VAHGDGERRSRTVQRVERQRERAEGPRPRESGETERELRLDGDECGRLGVEARRWDSGWEWTARPTGFKTSSHARGGGVCECDCVSLLGFYYFFFFVISY
jgi:hypothetical protein